jgi:hypothetical protein
MAYAVFPGDARHHLLGAGETRTHCGLPTKGGAGSGPARSPPARVTLGRPADAPALPCPACYKVEAFRLLARRMS